MTVKYQLSDKRGDAILLASAEGDDPTVVEQDFAEAVALAGLSSSYETFAQPAPTYPRPTTQGQAVQNVRQAFPAAAPLPAAATGGDGGAPQCQHGTKVYKESKPDAPKPWRAWACPARSSDPTRCEFEWIR